MNRTKTSIETFELIAKRHAEGEAIVDICKELNVKTSTFYGWQKRNATKRKPVSKKGIRSYGFTKRDGASSQISTLATKNTVIYYNGPAEFFPQTLNRV